MSTSGSALRITCWVHRKRIGGIFVPYVQLHSTNVILIATLGKPNGPFKQGNELYCLQNVIFGDKVIRRVVLTCRMSGAIDVTGSESDLSYFLDWFLDRVRKYNSTIINGVYGCRSYLEWSVLKIGTGEARLLPVVDEFRILLRSNRKVVGHWHLTR